MAFLAACTSLTHLLFILLVVFGALWTRRRPFWTTVHLLALVWGVIVEVAPVSCPLTLLEMYFQRRAGIEVIQGSYLIHCVDALIYPNAPYWLIAACGVAVCVTNFGIYIARGWGWMRRRRAGSRG